MQYFPDRFIRKEIRSLEICCTYSSQGCNWEGVFSELEKHLKTCLAVSYDCEFCGKNLTKDQIEEHKAKCQDSVQPCPLAKVGCQHTQRMSKEDLADHMSDSQIEHFTILADRIVTLEKKSNQTQPPQAQSKRPTRKQVASGERRIAADSGELIEEGEDGGYHTLPDLVETDGPNGYRSATKRSPMLLTKFVSPKQKMDIKVEVADPYDIDSHTDVVGDHLERKLQQQVGSEILKVRGDLQTFLMNELRTKTDEITTLRTTISKLERSVRSKHADTEDKDFRLSLIENSNYDGTMIWKIPQFSQRMSDAQNGKYTSIFSLPFYTSRYGYKMCMRLYILGDGIGKGSHMSLFFVLMKGEFDNILQWPFTHKVTFNLINQAGGRDVVDTFQPDPMSSSFRKPRSDMNIASGCPRFVSQGDLRNNGFIVDDTIFIKCIIDTATIRLP